MTMSKQKYEIREITAACAEPLLREHHYLTGVSKGFKSGVNYGLFAADDDAVLGVCIFTGFPVPELVVGLFGLPRADQRGFFELSRLCLHPTVQAVEHNITSWFVSRCMRLLRQARDVRAVLSYADADHHKGTTYAACNFRYYGLTAAKKDFYTPDGVKMSRGKTKGVDGQWLPRTRKHRWLIVYDKKLVPRWPAEVWDSERRRKGLDLV
jgi:hypothetical protein